MNPVEQRQRFTAVQTAERRIDDIETVVQALAREMVKDREAFDARIHAERTHRLALAGEQRGYLDNTYRLLNVALCAFRDRSFVERLRWLFLGV